MLSQGGSRPVVRALPIAVLRGAVGATEAFSKTFQGLQRELDGNAQEQEDKYKARSGGSGGGAAGGGGDAIGRDSPSSATSRRSRQT